MRLFLLLLLDTLAGLAQTPRAQGHVYFGLDSLPRSAFGFNSAGVGGDFFVYRGAAVSPSLGYLFQSGSPGSGLAVGTLNGGYHFNRGKGRFEPFATGGYGYLNNFSDSVATFNLGGGGQFWFRKRLGVRVEVLHFRHSSYHEMTSLRFGLAFR